MNLLTCITHDTELQVITVLSLISTLYKSPQHPLRLFQPAMSSSAVPWQRILAVEILQLQPFRFSCHNRPCRTLINCQLNYSAISSQPPLQSLAPIMSFLTARRGSRRQHPVSNSKSIVACIFVPAGTSLPSRYSETVVVYSPISQAVHTTILKWNVKK
jgi:hypothetical protein